MKIIDRVDGPEFIFRIQDSDGRGPYRPGFTKYWTQGREDHQYLHPWYIEFGRVDRLLLSHEHAGCGCQSMELLRRWFYPVEYNILKKAGFNAVKIKPDRILAISKIQCVFACNHPLNTVSEVIQLYSGDIPIDTIA